jgi:hypothetical protein
MSMLSKIFEKLGLKKAEAPAKPAAKPVMTKAPDWRPSQLPTKPAAKAMEMVDVTAMLDELTKKMSVPTNWRVSINDLMAILGMDHKPDDIKALAVELGCPESEMGDSYKRNVWTHKALLKKIAENGGRLPQELLD